MKNYVQPGDTLEYTNAGAAIASGDVVELPGIGIGVAAVDIAATTGVGSVHVCGVFKLAKEAPLAIAQGVRVYWDNVAKKVTTTVKPTMIGYSFLAALSADTVAYVKLVPMGDTEPGNLAQAAFVAPLGVTSDLVGVDGTGSNAAPLVGTEARLDAIEAKVDAALAALVAAGLMAAS
jgi:predicted RecA/RadA family phage recombinase